MADNSKKAPAAAKPQPVTGDSPAHKADPSVPSDKTSLTFKEKAGRASAALRTALAPGNVIKHLLLKLYKPLLFFLLLFFMALGGAYAASYYKLLDARSALDLEWVMPPVREAAVSRVGRELLPVAEWSVAVAAAAGDLIQTDVDRRAADRIREEQKLQAKKAQEELAAKQAEEKKQEQEKKPDETRPDAEERRRAERVKQQEQLRKIAEQRQQELNKRANRLAAYYAAMPPADAIKILKNMDNDEIIFILSRMPDATVSQILSGLEPERASALSQQILRLREAPDLSNAETGLL